MFPRFGVEVTILERNEQLLAHGYEPGVGKTIGEVFEKEGIRFLTKVVVRSVRQDREEMIVSADVDGKARELRVAKLIVATGRRPNSDKIDIEKAGVTVGKKGQVIVDEFLRTNISHIFAGGDVIWSASGSQKATPVGRQDGGIPETNVFFDQLTTGNNPRISSSIFYSPRIASPVCTH